MNDASVAAREAASWLTSAAGADAPPEQRVAVARYIGDAEGAVGPRAIGTSAASGRRVAELRASRAIGGDSEPTNGLLTAR